MELALKAKIAERLGLPGLFDEQNTAQQFAGLSELRRLVKTHNLTLLFVVSGLRPAFDQRCATDVRFAAGIVWLNRWNEGVRYRPPGAVTATEITDLTNFLADQNGLLQWIETH